MDTKQCGRCGEILDVSSFNRDKYTRTGYRSQCKLCMKKERERLNSYYKGWRDDHKEWYRRYRRDRYQRDKQKISARGKVNYAVRTGKIEKKPCEDCGAEKTHAHHDDYAKPLNVRWLCPPCHSRWHA